MEEYEAGGTGASVNRSAISNATWEAVMAAFSLAAPMAAWSLNELVIKSVKLDIGTDMAM